MTSYFLPSSLNNKLHIKQVSTRWSHKWSLLPPELILHPNICLGKLISRCTRLRPKCWTHLSSSVSFCRPFWVTPIRSSSNCMTLDVASSSLLFTSSFSSCRAWEEFCTSWKTIKYNDGIKFLKKKKRKERHQTPNKIQKKYASV